MPETLPDVRLHNGFALPEELKRRMLWGGEENGIRWLERAPEIVQEWCERWRITLDAEVPSLSFNLVLFGTAADHGLVVLKLSPPHDEVRAEVEATRAASGSHGLVRLIDSDPDVSIMLMERVIPGTPLRTLLDNGTMGDEEATRIVAGEMQKVWVAPPAGHHLFPLDRWFRALFAYHEAHPNGGGPLPHHLVELAVTQAREVLATQRELVVLHGDVHQDNILADAEEGWTLIDFKGLVGERGYDVGTWMRNPPGLESRPDLPQLINRRLDILTEELGIDRVRLWQWSMVHAVLSSCWTLESEAMAEYVDQSDAVVAQILFDMNPFSSR